MKISKLENIAPDRVTNIIFDWGGVITNIDYHLTIDAFSQLGHKSFDNFFTQHYQDELFKRYETGKASTNEILNEINREIGRPISEKEFSWAWCAMLLDTPLTRIELLKQLGEKYRLFLLSNTNKVHTTYYHEYLKRIYNINFPVLFEKVFYSHEVGMRKPDPEIFEYVLSNKNLTPSETLFIDDTEVNTDVASDAGMMALYLSNGYTMEKILGSWPKQD